MKDCQSAKPDEFLSRILKEQTDESHGCSVIFENSGRVNELPRNCLWAAMVSIFKRNGFKKLQIT